MALKDTVNSIVMNTTEIVKAVEEMGGTYGDNPKNLANTPDAIRTITGGGGGGWDPSNPTLEGLKDAIDKGEDIEIGIEIPDTYDGQSNPLIVAQKLDSSNNSTYGNAEGYILIRKYAAPTSQLFASTGIDYNNSTIYNFLQTTYLTNCSDTLKQLISEISVPCSGAQVKGKWQLMGAPEVGGTYVAGDGIFWQYWKQKTGLSSANNNANNGRIVTNNIGTAQNYWLRSKYSNTALVYVKNTGAVTNLGTPDSSYAVVPFCFIAKSTPPLGL